MTDAVGCMGFENDAKCTELGRQVGLGIALCTRHERKAYAYLLRRYAEMRKAHPPGSNGCMAAGCVIIGHGIGFGLRVCFTHEEQLMALLGARTRDREAHLVAEAACGDHWTPGVIDRASRFYETGSAGAPTLGKRGR